jgi:hypothetical protein
MTFPFVTPHVSDGEQMNQKGNQTHDQEQQQGGVVEGHTSHLVVSTNLKPADFYNTTGMIPASEKNSYGNYRCY